MDLKLPIRITDELAESVVESTGLLDLASGEIRSVEYEDYDADALGLPAEQEDYEFTSGTLSNGDREVEFRVDVDLLTGKYSVTPSELLELKGRAAKLFTAPPGTQTVVPQRKRR
ncbi:MAG TPA: hypothetical protein PL196_01230 [Burkholderiaceae bacterium]|nr:hypothetical protein [Burkholderiaceae bacterium]